MGTFTHRWSVKGEVYIGALPPHWGSGAVPTKNLCKSTNAAMHFSAYFEDISIELFAFFTN